MRLRVANFPPDQRLIGIDGDIGAMLCRNCASALFLDGERINATGS